jgi:hypothetical protein
MAFAGFRLRGAALLKICLLRLTARVRKELLNNPLHNLTGLGNKGLYNPNS